MDSCTIPGWDGTAAKAVVSHRTWSSGLCNGISAGSRGSCTYLTLDSQQRAVGVPCQLLEIAGASQHPLGCLLLSSEDCKGPPVVGMVVFSRYGGVGLMVGLYDFRGLFQIMIL